MADHGLTPPDKHPLWRRLAFLLGPEVGPPTTVRLHVCHAPHLAQFAERIIDRLKGRSFGFTITTSTDAGARSAARNADFVLVVIDKRWRESLQLDTPDGEIPHQVELALASPNSRVVPLLVGNAELPSAAQLGARLAPLVRRNAFSVDPGRSFEHHVTELFDEIQSPYRKLRLRVPFSTSRTGAMARVGRFLDRAIPIAIPSEEVRGWSVSVVILFAFGALILGGSMVLAIANGELVMALICGGVLLLNIRIAVPEVREAFSKPFFDGKPEIFLSYRRDDVFGMSNRIYDRLRQRLGRQKVFMDVEGCLPIGVDFQDYLEWQMSSSLVYVILIGPNWVGRDLQGKVRIFDDLDFVRAEVTYALRSGKPVVVVLLDQTSFDEPELPDGLQGVGKLPAFVARGGTPFEDDVRRLTVRLREMVKGLRPSLRERWTQPLEVEIGWPWWARALVYVVFMSFTVSFVAAIYRANWNQAWGPHAAAVVCGVTMLRILGKLIGAVREGRSGHAAERR